MNMAEQAAEHLGRLVQAIREGNRRNAKAVYTGIMALLATGISDTLANAAEEAEKAGATEEARVLRESELFVIEQVDEGVAYVRQCLVDNGIDVDSIDAALEKAMEENPDFTVEDAAKIGQKFRKNMS